MVILFLCHRDEWLKFLQLNSINDKRLNDKRLKPIVTSSSKEKQIIGHDTKNLNI